VRRVCRVGGTSAGQPAGHAADGGPADHRLGVGWVAFIAAGQAAMRGQPGQRALDRPPSRDDGKPFWPLGLRTILMLVRRIRAAQSTSWPAKPPSANTNRTGPTCWPSQRAKYLLDRAAGQGVLRPGLVVLADKGLAGRAFTQVVAELDAVLVRPDRADEPARFGSLGGVRQWIEAIIDTLKNQLSLEGHGAHTIQGVWIRVAQRLLALATGVWFNWQLGAPVKRSLVAYDH
jgi:hypothetical protein